jgi:hypothetical protein
LFFSVMGVVESPEIVVMRKSPQCKQKESFAGEAVSGMAGVSGAVSETDGEAGGGLMKLRGKNVFGQGRQTNAVIVPRNRNSRHFPSCPKSIAKSQWRNFLLHRQ